MSSRVPSAPPIAIIGIACRFPGANTAEEFWQNLAHGVESIERAGLGHADARSADPASDQYVRAAGRIAGIEEFDAEHFRVPPSEAALLDPQHRLLLELGAEVLDDAGYGTRTLVTGVFVGAGKNAYLRENVLGSSEFDPTADESRATLANEKDFLSQRLAFKLGLTGPAVTVQTSCSTSLTAVALACQALTAGDCDLAIAGGVSLLMPDVDGYAYREGSVLSPDGRCRPFDARAAGTVPASGAGLVLLKRDDDAERDRDRRRAVIRGWAITSDGADRAGFAVPTSAGQSEAVRRAMQRAGIAPSMVTYIEAHGTGTHLGDPIEIAGLRTVFTEDGDWQPASCAIGSVKSNIGHTDAAAGVAGLIKTALALESGFLPASLHFETPNPELRLDESPFLVNAIGTDWAPRNGRRLAGVSSFGMGGTNAHVVVESAPTLETEAPERLRQLLALSARTVEELSRMRERLASRLQASGDLSPGELADVAFTLAVGRPRYSHRWAATASSHGEAIAALRSGDAATGDTGRWSLAITGRPDDFAALVDQGGSVEPLLQEALQDLAEAAPASRIGDRSEDVDDVTAARGGLAVVAVCAALARVGMRPVRIEGPAWAEPAIHWFETRSPLEDLAAALQKCGAEPDEVEARVTPSTIEVDHTFALTDVMAKAWNLGVDLELGQVFDSGRRQRLSLPAYPFTRKRHWLSPITPTLGKESATALPPQSETRPTTDAVVLATWQEVLGNPEISLDDHFSDDLDGDSILAYEIMERLISHFALELPIDLPFTAPTVRDSSAYIRGLQAEDR